MNDSLRRATFTSEFAWGPRHPPRIHGSSSWTQRQRTDLKELSRDASRCWIAIYSGKTHLNGYLHGRFGQGTTSHCPCSSQTQNMHHMLTDCTLPRITKYRQYMRTQYHRMHETFSRDFQRTHNKRWPHAHTWHTYDHENIMTYTHPPTYYPYNIRLAIMKLIIGLYRTAVGYHSYGPTVF